MLIQNDIPLQGYLLVLIPTHIHLNSLVHKESKNPVRFTIFDSYCKVTSVWGVALIAAHLGSFLNFTQLASLQGKIQNIAQMCSSP